MHLQNLAPEAPRDNTLEQIEARTLPPKELGRTMLREADAQVTQAKSEIAEIQAQGFDDPDLDAQLAALEETLNSGFTKLREDIAIATSPRASGARVESVATSEVPVRQQIAQLLEQLNTTGSVPARLVELINDPDGEGQNAFGYELGDAFGTIFLGSRVNFTAFEALASLADQAPSIRADIAQELGSQGGKVYADRLLNDAAYRKELGELQDLLSGSYEGVLLCVETNLMQLVLAKEIFGSPERIQRAIKAMDLSGYNSGFKVDPSKFETILRLSSPSLKSDGKIKGYMTAELSYEDSFYLNDKGVKTNGGSPAIRRIFGIDQHTEESGSRTERYAKLELIDLPRGLQRTGTGSRELAASENELAEAGFDSHKLEANIDKGGYVWAIKKFTWDIQAMRETLPEMNETMPEAEVLRTFIQLQIDVMHKNLAASSIDASDPELAAWFAELAELAQNPLATTPARLAEIGKEGSKFIIVSEVLDGNAEQKRKKVLRRARDGETGEHFGKILMLSSRWFGKRKPEKTS